jgi:hypothetical protein
MKTKTPTLEQFKQFSADIAPAARAVLMARIFAELERERVNAYIRPIFDSYRFEYAERWKEIDGCRGLIQDPDHLYLCDDEPMMRAYYADCDDAHRAHGFKGPQGHCPALTAEHLVTVTERALIDLAEPLFGVSGDHLCGENRTKYLELLIGAALKAEKEGAAA